MLDRLGNTLVGLSAVTIGTGVAVWLGSPWSSYMAAAVGLLLIWFRTREPRVVRARGPVSDPSIIAFGRIG